MISVKELNVSYTSGRSLVRAVENVSFEIGTGEAYGLVGESGSGKSTIVRTMMGLIPGWTGEIKFENTHVTARHRSKALCKNVQMVFQDPYGSLHPRHTVHRVLAEPLAIHGIGDVERRISTALRDVGLDPAVRFRYPHQLSGGQRQRVAIARALILEPSVLLLDEPTSALDVSVQAEILALFAQIRRERGLTMLLVTHNLAVVAQMCERIAVMRGGRIEEELTAVRLRAGATQHPYTQGLLAASKGFQRPAPTTLVAN